MAAQHGMSYALLFTEWGNGGVQDTRFNNNFIQSYASGEVSLAAGN